MLTATLHGAGRFAQHLLHAWLNEPDQYRLQHLCDEKLSLDTLVGLLNNHDKLDFSAACPAIEADCLALTDSHGQRHRLRWSNSLDCAGDSQLWLECSGRHSHATNARHFHTGRTRHVLVSASCPGANQTLIMGFNHSDYRTDAAVISYGSCTVNAFIPLAQHLYLQRNWHQAQVEVIHNSPAHASLHQPRRQHCTLQDMAPQLLPWLAPGQLHVSYTLIPWQGPSLINMRFELARPACAHELTALLAPLQPLYHFAPQDTGLNPVINSRYNAEFPLSEIELSGHWLSLKGYFDNENSAYRYHQLIQHICQQ